MSTRPQFNRKFKATVALEVLRCGVPVNVNPFAARDPE